jgi:hypothetical protein
VYPFIRDKITQRRNWGGPKKMMRSMAGRFIACCQMLGHRYMVRGHDVTRRARQYLSGLPGTQRRKNIEPIEEDVAESDYQGVQHFVSGSPWGHTAAIRRVGEQAEAPLWVNCRCRAVLPVL